MTTAVAEPIVLAEFCWATKTMRATHTRPLRSSPYGRNGYRYAVDVSGHHVHPVEIRCNSFDSMMKLFDFIAVAWKVNADIDWLFEPVPA
jgi:hypothetical protein